MFKYPTAPKASPAPAPASPFNENEWATPAGAAPDSQPTGQGLFGASAATPSSPFDAAVSAQASAGSSRNVLNSDVSVVGILRFTDDLLVDGSVEGEITSDGVLTVGENAVIQAGEKNKVAVRTKSAIIQGRVTGDIVVTDRVELASTAELVGDVTASKISIEEGAVFIGHCMVGAAAAGAAMAAPTVKKAGKASKNDSSNLLG